MLFLYQFVSVRILETPCYSFVSAKGPPWQHVVAAIGLKPGRKPK